MTLLHQGLSVSDHSLIKHKLSFLRQPEKITSTREFESLVHEITLLLGYDVSKDLPLRPMERTGEQVRPGVELTKMPIIVPIIRPGLMMFDAMRQILSTPYAGHIGIYDDEATKSPKTFMLTLPEDMKDRPVILLDLVINRGRTSCHALNEMRAAGAAPSDISMVVLASSKQGIETIAEDDRLKKVRIFCGHLDTEDDQMLDDLSSLNYRLFRTRNRNASKR